MKISATLKSRLPYLALFWLIFITFLCKSYYDKEKSNVNTDQKTIEKRPLLLIEEFNYTWKTEYNGDRYLVISGYLKNVSEHYFDQILRSFKAAVNFKNGHVKNLSDNAETISKDNIDFSNMISYSFNMVVKSFLKNDQVLKPGEKIFFKFGHESAGKLIILNKNELHYPIESIKFVLIAEARSPLNDVWRGELISCEVPLK